MKIKDMKLTEIKPYENNPRNNEGAIKFVVNSIKQFGFQVPIVVDKDNVIVAGHTRYEAAKELGLETIPVVVAAELTPEQVKAFRLADNKTAEKASWDYVKLGQEIEDLLDMDLDFDLTDIGFGEFELATMTGDFEPEGFDEEETAGYEDIGESMLAKKRIIISYLPEEEDKVKALLGIDEITKVAYSISDFDKDKDNDKEEE